MRLITVGTGTAVPRPERGGSSALVIGGGVNLVVDLGMGSLHGLSRAGLAHRDADAVFFTHLHPDHVAETASLFFAANYDPVPRTRPLALFGSKGLIPLFEGLDHAFGRWMEPKRYTRTFFPLNPGDSLGIGGMRLAAGPANHDPSSLSLRVWADGFSLAVTGDTGPCPELADFARGVDLLLAEASLATGEEAETHLTAEEAGRLATAAGAGRLVLTHFYQASEADDPEGRARKTYSGSVTAARDGMEFTFP